MKRKRELEEEAAGGEDREEKECFRKNKMTPKSPVRIQGGEGKGDIRRAFEGWMEEFKGRRDRMEKNLEDIRRELKDMRRREEEWRIEKERLNKRIGELELKWEKGLRGGNGEGKIEELEGRIRALEEAGGKVSGDRGGDEMKEKVRSLERERERREKFERRNNVVMKGFKEQEGGARKGVEEMFRQIGADVRVKEVRMVKTRKEKRGGMTVMRLRKRVKGS